MRDMQTASLGRPFRVYGMGSTQARITEKKLSQEMTTRAMMMTMGIFSKVNIAISSSRIGHKY